MSVDFEKYRKLSKYHKDETLEKVMNPKKSLPTKNEAKEKKNTPKETKNPPKSKKPTPKGNTRHKLTESAKERLDKESATNTIPQLMTGATYAVANNSPFGIAYSIATGKKLVEPTENDKKYGLDKSGAYKVGNVLGTMASYATPYKLGEKAIAKGASKVLGTKGAKEIVEKVIGSKVGKKVGEKAVRGVTEGLVKNTIGDATIGTVMNLGMARGEGLEGKDLAKDMGINALLDLGIGGAVEAFPFVKKAVKNSLLDWSTKGIKSSNVPTLKANKANFPNVKRADLPTKNTVEPKVTPKVETVEPKVEVTPKVVEATVKTQNSVPKDVLEKEIDGFAKKVEEGTATGVDRANIANKVTDNLDPIVDKELVDKFRDADDELLKQMESKGTNPTPKQNDGIPTDQTLKPNGADVAREPKTIDEVRAEYGTYGNEAETPLRTDYGKVSQGAKTISDSVPEEARQAVEEGIRVGDYFSKETHNADFQKSAREEIANDIDNAKKIFDEKRGGHRDTSENIIRGIELGNEYARRGLFEKMEEVFADVSNMASEAGRTLQAMRLFNSLSPQGRMRSVVSGIERLAKERKVDIKISDDLYDALKNAKTEKEVNKAKKAIFDEAWSQIPGNWQEKLDGLRYLGMLGNPKTHIRNILGNALYVPVRTIDDVFTAVFEKAFNPKLSRLGGNKTVAFVGLTGDDKELRKFAKEQFKELQETIMGDSSKYMDRVRPQGSNIFKTKIMNFFNNLNSNLLEAEDKAFMGMAFRDSFAKYCKANGKTVGNMSDAFIKEATEYAQEKALKATYRDANEIADALSRFRKKLNVKATDSTDVKLAKTIGGIAMDSALPFKKTPINILKRAVEHTPVGLVEGIGKVVSAKDAKTLRDGIELLSEGLTGTGILGLGMLLGERGVVNGNLGEYGQERNFEQLQGKQDYALNIGGISITLDWAAPSSMPFFVGVELGQKLFVNGKEDKLWDTMEAMLRMADPIFEMSMLSGVENIFDYINSYDAESGIPKFIGASVQNLASQFFPTLFGQVARTVTTNRKTTLSTATNNTQKKAEKFGQKLANKVPGLSETSPDYVDMWGRTETKETTGDYIREGLENFLSPAYISSDKSTFVDKKLIELSKDIELTEILPQDKYSYDISFNGMSHRMSTDEFTQYKKTVGQTAHKELDKLFRTKEFDNMTAKEKQKAINGVYSNAKEKAKEEYLVNSGNATKQEIALSNLPKATRENVVKTKVDPVKALEAYELGKPYEKEYEKASAIAKKYDAKTMRGLGFNDRQILYGQLIAESGVDPKKIDSYYEKAKSYDPKTKSTGVSQHEAEAVLRNDKSLTEKQRYALYGAIYTSKSKKGNPFKW